MTKTCFARWWYVRSDKGFVGPHGPFEVELYGEEGGKKRALQLFSRLGVREAKTMLRKYGDTNVRAIRVTVWRKEK